MTHHVDEHHNDGWHGKYFTIMLNMADDDLDPFEYRLLGHYIRVCGQAKGGVCFQTVRTIAQTTRMSVPTVIKTRIALVEKGYVRVEERPNKSHAVTVVDRMAENIQRYADQDIEPSGGQTSHDQNIEHGDQDIDHGDQNSATKEKPNKNNPQEVIADTPSVVSAANDQKRAPTRKRTGRKKRRFAAEQINPVKDRIVELFGWSWDTMTPEEAGRVQKAAHSWLIGGGALDELAVVYAYCAREFDHFGPNALTSNKSKALAASIPAPIKRPAPPDASEDISADADDFLQLPNRNSLKAA